MKALYTTLLFLFIQQLYADELTWVDEQVAAIKPPRVGISQKEIEQIKNPFISSHKEKKKSSIKVYKHTHFIKRYYTKKLSLEAILNKSVLINRRWYKEGAWVYGYRLIKVNSDSAILQKQGRKLRLSTVSKNRNLIFYNK